MNKVILIGRLTRDPEVRYSQGSDPLPIARYSLAVDRRRSGADGQREADFINCVSFGRQAEFAEKYLRQGSKIAVTGRIQTGSYTNKDGQKVYTTEVVIEDQEFDESRAEADRRRGTQSQDSGYRGGYSQGGNYSQAPQSSYSQGGNYSQAPQSSYSQGGNYSQAPQEYHQQGGGYARQPAAGAPGNDGGPAYEEPRESHPGGSGEAAQVGEGFMNIPEGVEDEGLPFN